MSAITDDPVAGGSGTDSAIIAAVCVSAVLVIVSVIIATATIIICRRKIKDNAPNAASIPNAACIATNIDDTYI